MHPERRRCTGPERFLSIAMATFDDYDGVYFTAQSIRLYHPEITAQSEILVLDNHPDGPAAAALKQLDSCVVGYRYVPYGGHCGTAVRDLLFREANAQWVLCVDSHVQFAPGSLARLVEFLGEHGDSVDLWQGPLLNDNLYSVSSHLAPVWSAGMYGQWREDPRAASALTSPRGAAIGSRWERWRPSCFRDTLFNPPFWAKPACVQNGFKG